MGGEGADESALELMGYGGDAGSALELMDDDVAGGATLEAAGAEDAIVDVAEPALMVDIVGKAMDDPAGLEVEMYVVCRVTELIMLVTEVVIEVVLMEVSVVVFIWATEEAAALALDVAGTGAGGGLVAAAVAADIGPVVAYCATEAEAAATAAPVKMVTGSQLAGTLAFGGADAPAFAEQLLMKAAEAATMLPFVLVPSITMTSGVVV